MKYKKSNIIAKSGVNFVKTIVESSGCLFHKIEQENDLGIDAIIEFIKNEKPAHKSLALQIKSGTTYYNPKNKECIIPVESHYEYWSNYALPVCGVVYVPELEKGYWINIKSYLKDHKNAKRIKFIANRSNLLNFDNFNRLFIPNILNEIPFLPFEEALSFFDSENKDEFNLGAVVLFRRYINNPLTWDRFLYHILNTEAENISYRILHYISHIPWHSDIFFSGEMASEETRRNVKDKLRLLDKIQVIKLLSLIDDEVGIQRGNIGQTIESILSCIDNIDKYLSEIIMDKNLSIDIRHAAATIYAFYNGIKSIPLLSKIESEDSWYIPEIVTFLKKYKSYNPYG